MAARNRPVPTIFGEDPEYSKVLTDKTEPLATAKTTAPDLAEPKKLEAAPPTKPERTVRDEGSPAATRMQAAAPKNKPVDATQVIVIKPAVRPLERQWAELAELEKANYQITMIIRLALQQTQKNTVIQPNHQALSDDEAGTGQAERAYATVTRGVIAALSESAGDLGTMSAARLARPQVQRAFVAELDKVIEKLKRKL